jgi:tRNA A37 N6-isopentenylltransferase MiaA
MTGKPLRICITGPTATGKTDAAVQVCRAIGVRPEKLIKTLP